MRYRSLLTLVCVFGTLGLSSPANASKGERKEKLRSEVERPRFAPGSMSLPKRVRNLNAPDAKEVAMTRTPAEPFAAQVLGRGDSFSYKLVNDSEQEVIVHLELVDQDNVSQAQLRLRLLPDATQNLSVPLAPLAQDSAERTLRTKVRITSPALEADPSVEVTQRVNRALLEGDTHETQIMDCTVQECSVRPSLKWAQPGSKGLGEDQRDRLDQCGPACLFERGLLSPPSDGQEEEPWEPDKDNPSAELPRPGPGPDGPHRPGPGPDGPHCPEIDEGFVFGFWP